MSGPARPVNWYHVARGLRAAGVKLTEYGRQLAAAKAPLPASGICGRCHANTTFTLDPDEQALMSDCCWAPEWNPPEAA